MRCSFLASIPLLCLLLMLLFHLIYAQPLQIYLISPARQKVNSTEHRNPAPSDIFHQLLIGIYHSQALARAKKHKKPPPKHPQNHQLLLDRLGFGNLSFNLGFTFSFQLSNSVGVGNRQQSGLLLSHEAPLRVN